MKKFSRLDQQTLAKWAATCAARVLPLIEEARPNDVAPRQAIETCRTWVRTGRFNMAKIRQASLAAHRTAKKVEAGSPAALAAHAAGQAVATAHVAQHAWGAAYYALRAVAAKGDDARVARERLWQAKRLPGHLKREFLHRLTLEQRAGGTAVRLRKGPGF